MTAFRPRCIAFALVLSAMSACNTNHSSTAEANVISKKPSKTKTWDPALLAVEKDQASGADSRRNLANRNLLLGRYRNYAHCSIYRSGCFARNVQDGDLKRKWALPDDVKQGWVDASLGLLTTFDKVVVREDGVRVLAFELKAYDGRQWQSLARGEELGTKVFRFKPLQASAFRIDITTRGGGGIAEIEVYNTAAPDSTFPTGPSPALRRAFAGGDRVAILLGSPYAMMAQGKVLFNPRDPEVRPLPDSERYLKEVIAYVAKACGAKFALPGGGTFSTRDQVVGAFKQVAKRGGVSCLNDPRHPMLLVFGPTLPEAGGILDELQALLRESPAVRCRGGLADCPPLPANYAINPDEAEAVQARRNGAKKGVPNAQKMAMAWDKDTWRQYQWGYYRLVELADKRIGECIASRRSRRTGSGTTPSSSSPPTTATAAPPTAGTRSRSSTKSPSVSRSS